MIKNHFFICGLPSVGKTTAILRIVQSLPFNWTGFYTQNIIHQNIKQGLMIKSLNGLTMEIKKTGVERPAYSKYDFDTQAFDHFLEGVFASMNDKSHIVIDELGSLFCRSKLFEQKIIEWLERFPMMGVIANSGHRLIETIHRRNDTEILTVTSQNRDELVSMLIHRLTYQQEK
jgi:nucleoside-triphosphatase THEP1